MIERPYRSGAMQKCLLCRQPNEIQEKVLKMAKSHINAEIVDWLKTVGIAASICQVQYYLRKSGTPRKKDITKPKGSYTEKVEIYIDEMLKHNGKTFTLWTLNMRGTSWTVVTKALHNDGLISSMGGHPRNRWKILASKDELRMWRDEVQKPTHRGDSYD